MFPENFYRFEYIGENRIVGYQYDFTSNASGGFHWKHIAVPSFDNSTPHEMHAQQNPRSALKLRAKPGIMPMVRLCKNFCEVQTYGRDT